MLILTFLLIKFFISPAYDTECSTAQAISQLLQPVHFDASMKTFFIFSSRLIFSLQTYSKFYACNSPQKITKKKKAYAINDTHKSPVIAKLGKILKKP
jgi:hypothetical protein